MPFVEQEWMQLDAPRQSQERAGSPDVSLSQELLVSCIRSERGKALTRHIQPRHTKGFGARLVREMSDLSYNVTRQVAFHQPEVQSS